MYKLYFTKDALKDAKKIKNSQLKPKVEELLKMLEQDPVTQPYKSLKGEFEGSYSKRINLQYRLFYEVDKQGKRVKILRMWTRYGDN